MGYDSSKLTLTGQPIAGFKEWIYYDTGGETVAVYTGAGWFTDAKDRGVDTGDSIDLINAASGIRYQGRFSAVQDTGASQGTVTLDTGSL